MVNIFRKLVISVLGMHAIISCTSKVCLLCSKSWQAQFGFGHELCRHDARGFAIFDPAASADFRGLEQTRKTCKNKSCLTTLANWLPPSVPQHDSYADRCKD